jgi:hypothetical protein
MSLAPNRESRSFASEYTIEFLVQIALSLKSDHDLYSA